MHSASAHAGAHLSQSLWSCSGIRNEPINYLNVVQRIFPRRVAHAVLSVSGHVTA